MKKIGVATRQDIWIEGKITKVSKLEIKNYLIWLIH